MSKRRGMMSVEKSDVVWAFIGIATLIIVIGFACLAKLDRIQQDVDRLWDAKVYVVRSTPK